MKIQSLSYKPIHINNKQKQTSNTTANKNMHFSNNNSFMYYPVVSFGKEKQTEYSKVSKAYSDKVDLLSKKGIKEADAKSLANLGPEKFKKVLDLSDFIIYPIQIKKLLDYDDNDFEKVLKLAELGFMDDDNIDKIIKSKRLYKKALWLGECGISSENIPNYMLLNPLQLKRAINLIKRGESPENAITIAELPRRKIPEYQKLLDSNVDMDTAQIVPYLKRDLKKKFYEYVDKGLAPYNALDIAAAEPEFKEKVDTLLELGFYHEAIPEVAMLDGEDFENAISLFNEGVLSEYIFDIVKIENGNKTNNRYKKYLEEGLSKNSAFAITRLNKEDFTSFCKIRQANPEIKELLKDNYNVEIINLQYEKKAIAIFSKEFYTSDKKAVILTKIYDENGNISTSRSAETQDNYTSSWLKNGNEIYHIKYNRFNNAEELTQVILDKNTYGIKGVMHSKYSNILPEAIETTYYDISDFIEDSAPETINFDIMTSLKPEAKGKPLSVIKKNSDGSITYTEDITVNNYRIQREYYILKDKKGMIQKSKYEYRITNPSGEKILDINNSFNRDKTGTVYNTINGVQYTITYDDKKHIVTISDGIKTKQINMSEKISGCSSKTLWQITKSLDVSTLLIISDVVKKWQYCNDDSSIADGGLGVLSTGKEISTILHETGHFKEFANRLILKDEELIDIYNNEMSAFEKNMPYNEQGFLRYFSRYGDTIKTNGLSELQAETNIFTGMPGIKDCETSIRSPLLVRYFPETITKIMNSTGAASRESLLK